MNLASHGKLSQITWDVLLAFSMLLDMIMCWLILHRVCYLHSLSLSSAFNFWRLCIPWHLFNALLQQNHLVHNRRRIKIYASSASKNSRELSSFLLAQLFVVQFFFQLVIPMAIILFSISLTLTCVWGSKKCFQLLNPRPHISLSHDLLSSIKELPIWVKSSCSTSLGSTTRSLRPF